jgi:serine/threonine-protein kinase
MAEREANPEPRIIGRYELHEEVASGGMATVHLGRMVSDVGFSRTVAIKRLHPHLARDPMFSAMFIDEARLAARIQHPNVVSTLDVVATEGELFVVMDYVRGEALWKLIRLTVAKGEFIPIDFVSSIAVGMLDGLHAAHEAKNEDGQPLGIVHRDVSPQNVLVGVDGIARVIDFGVAKAAGRMQTTRDGQLKGKLGYMPPEQFEGRPPDRRGDIYSAAVVLWEALTGQRLFEGQTEAETFRRILTGPPEPPSVYAPPESSALDDIVMRALARDPDDRFPTARQMALAIERAVPPAPGRRVGEWVSTIAADLLDERARRVTELGAREASSVYVAPVLDDDRTEWQPLAGPPPPQTQSKTLKIVPGLAGELRPKTDAPTRIEVVTAIRKSAPNLGLVSAGERSDDTVKQSGAPLYAPTPLHPIVPSTTSQHSPVVSSPPAALEPGSDPASVGPASDGQASTMGASWTETREGAAWKVVFRPVSLWLVASVVAFALTIAGWIVSERERYGVEGILAMIGLLVVAFAVVMRMLQSTHFRFDPEKLSIEHRPSGRSVTIAIRHIARFIVVAGGPGRDPRSFSVQVLPFEGAPDPLDVDFSSEVEARKAMQRFNEMLDDVRGG